MMLIRHTRWIGLWFSCALAAACEDGGGADSADAGALVDAMVTDAAPPDAAEVEAPPEGCNPVGNDQHCLLPWPSDYWTMSGPEGRRVSISDEATLVADNGALADIHQRREIDGFPPHGPILSVWPRQVDAEALVFHDDPIERTLEATNTTLLLDVERGALVAHFAELDPRAERPDEQALVLRPMAPLRSGARYIVAIQGLPDVDGELLQAPDGFRRLRDGEDPPAVADHYEADIFPALEAAGVARAGLQLAWDFTVRDLERARRDMLDGVEVALAAMAMTPPTVTITAVDEIDDVNEAEGTFWQVEGVITAPRILEGDAGPGSPLLRDAEGRVTTEGIVEVPFTALIPPSVLEGSAPAPLMQFGHGFFGGRDEIIRSFPPQFIQGAGMIAIAVDWWGMSAADGAGVLGGLARDPAGAFDFVDRVHQAMVNQIALSAAREAIAADPALTVETPDGPRALVDPEPIHFYGISQGHILGGVLVSLSPHFTRSALSVGGGSFTFMMFRAWPFQAFLQLIEGRFPSPLDQQAFAAMSQWVLDVIDPVVYAPLAFDNPPAWAAPDRRLLLHAGWWDTHVTPLATQVHARALGIQQVTPATQSVYGLEPAAPPIEGSALMMFDFMLEPPYPGYTATPPTEGGSVHGDVRRLPTSQRQVRQFFETGVIEAVCEGPCDPE